MHLERLKFLLKDTAIYGIANASSKLILFFTLPIIVNSINNADFGVWNLLTIVAALISAISIFGMDSAVIRYYYDDESKSHHQRVYTHGILLQFILSMVLCMIAYLLGPFILSSLKIPLVYNRPYEAILFWIPANVLTSYLQNWFKWTFQRMRFLIISIGLASCNLIFIYLFSRYNLLELTSLIWINVAAYWSFLFVGIYWCKGFFRFEYQPILFKNLVAFGFPMMLVMLTGIISPSLDRIFLTHHLSSMELGVYSFCQKLSIIMTVAVAAFQTAFGPFSYSIWSQADAPKTFARFQNYYLYSMGTIAIIICAFAKPMFIYLGNETFLPSVNYYFILVLGSLIYGLYSFASLGIFYKKKMRLNLLSLLIGLAVTFLSNVILIPKFGESAAAFGFTIGNVALISSGYIFSRKLYPISFNIYKNVFWASIVSLLLYASTFDLSSSLFVDTAFKLFISLPVYIAICALLLSKDERAFGLRTILKLFRA